MNKLFLGAAAALTIAAPAHAISFFSIGATGPVNAKVDPGLAAFETALVDFDNAPHTGVSVSTAGTAMIYTGSIGGVTAAPVGDTTQYLALGTGGSATINFAPYFTAMQHRVRSLSVYVGSVDAYNYIDVLDTNGAVLKTIGGSDLPGSNGDQGAALTNRRLYINFDPTTEDVGALRFRSDGVAFEFDTIGASSALFQISPNDTTTPGDVLPLAAVPEPAMWSLMIGGFGLVGGTLRRRARAARAIA